jgi:hypothetical protein
MNKLPTLQDLQAARERTKAIIAALHQYFEICAEEYPDTFQSCTTAQASPAQQYSAAAECAYYLKHGALPEWAYVIEKVENYDGNLLFIWADLGKVN